MFRIGILLIATTLIYSAQAQSFSVEDILSAPFPTNLVAAPVGDQVAWVQNKEGVRNILHAEAPAYKGQRITDYKEDDGQEISNLTFTPDGKSIIFVRGAAANRRGEYPNPALISAGIRQEIYIIKAIGTPPEFLATGSSPSLSSDGQQLAFIRRGQIWIKRLGEGTTVKPLLKIRGGAGQLRWSPVEPNLLAFVSRRGDHSYVGIFDLNSNKLQYLHPSVDNDSNPVWSPDGRQLAFIRTPNEKQILPFAPRRTALPWSIMVHN